MYTSGTLFSIALKQKMFQKYVYSNIIYLQNVDYSLIILLRPFHSQLVKHKTQQNCSKRKVIKLANGFRKPNADF